MPDGALVALDSENLALCWSLDDHRFNFSTNHIEMGPTFEAISRQRNDYHAKGIDFASSNSDIWWSMNLESSPNVDTSNTFRDLYAYARTTRDMQFFLNGTGAAGYFYDTALTGQAIDEEYDMEIDSDTDDDSGEIIGTTKSLSGLPRVVTGWQYSGINQDVEPLDDWEEDWDSKKYAARFVLDPSISPGAAVVPYNSTIWYRSRLYRLEAPFLELGRGCGPHNNVFTSLGSCVCYRGQPINYDWYNNDNMRCVNSKGYVWGFASFITIVGLIMEAAWAVGCWGLWLDANVNSKLLKYRRTGSGPVRSALDVAESINRDLGANTCAYSNGELEKSLDKCEMIGFAVLEKEGVDHIGVVSKSMKNSLVVGSHRLYGRR